MMAQVAAMALSVAAGALPYYGMVPKDFGANLEFRREMILMCGSDKKAAAEVRTMCERDLLFYVNTFCWTYDPRSSVKVTPFITYDFQDDAMMQIADCIEVGEDFAMPKSRDMGASWMGLTVFEHFWHFRDDMSFLLVSRNEDYVDKKGNPKALFWKIDFLHEHQPRWLLPEGRWLGWDDPNRKLLHLRNSDTGSVIDGESTTGDAGRGDRRTAMFIDEHAAFELNDGFRVLRATRDTTKCRGFNSTPQGANNGFYEVVHSTAARLIRLHWSKHPEKNKGLYSADSGKVVRHDDYRGLVKVRKKGEKEIRTVMYPDDYPFVLDGKLRSPWYDNECARCVNDAEIAQELDIDFIGSDHQFFDNETIELLRKKYAREPMLVGFLEYDPETLEPRRFREDSRGNISLWVTLNGDGGVGDDRRFVIGSDISAGTGASNSVSCVVDKATGEKVGVLRSPNLSPTAFADLTVALAKFFNRSYMIWDASGPTGKTFTMRVISDGYGNVYYRKQDKKIGQQMTDEPGYYLNPTARDYVLCEYREALGNHKYINRSDAGLKECLQFIRLKDGTVEHSAAANANDPSGARAAHGDEVIADAMASLALAENTVVSRGTEPEIPENCLAARMRRKAEEEASRKRDSLGEGW